MKFFFRYFIFKFNKSYSNLIFHIQTYTDRYVCIYIRIYTHIYKNIYTYNEDNTFKVKFCKFMSDWAKWSNCLQKQLPFLKLNIIGCLYIRKFTIQLDKLQESIVTYLVEPAPIKKCPMLRPGRYLNRRL